MIFATMHRKIACCAVFSIGPKSFELLEGYRLHDDRYSCDFAFFKLVTHVAEASGVSDVLYDEYYMGRKINCRCEMDHVFEELATRGISCQAGGMSYFLPGTDIWIKRRRNLFLSRAVSVVFSHIHKDFAGHDNLKLWVV